MFKPFYVHENQGAGKLPNRNPRGFTALISPVDATTAVALGYNIDDANRLCSVQVTFCSPKDQFCKKEGRSQAQAAPAKVINKRDLPKLIASVALVMLGRDDTYISSFTNRYLYLLKYVI